MYKYKKQGEFIRSYIFLKGDMLIKPLHLSVTQYLGLTAHYLSDIFNFYPIPNIGVHNTEIVHIAF